MKRPAIRPRPSVSRPPWPREVGGQAHASLGRSETAYGAIWKLVWVCFYAILFGDVVSKWLSEAGAVAVRYVPEGVLYCLALGIFLARWRARPSAPRFPLGVPLISFALSALVSALIHGGGVLLVVAAYDFRAFFRFVALAYLAFCLAGAEGRRVAILRHIRVVAGIQIALAAAQIPGGTTVRVAVAPAPLWIGGYENPPILDGPRHGWLSGASSNYNHFGFLMAMICVLEMVRATRGRPGSLIFAVTAGGRWCCLTRAIPFSLC